MTWRTGLVHCSALNRIQWCEVVKLMEKLHNEAVKHRPLHVTRPVSLHKKFKQTTLPKDFDCFTCDFDKMTSTIGKPQGTQPNTKVRKANNKENMDEVAAKLNHATDREARFDETSTREIEEIPKTRSRKSIAKVETMDHLALTPATGQHIAPAPPPPLRLSRIISLVLSYSLQLPLALLPGAKRPIFRTIGTIISLINYVVLTLFWLPTVLISLDFVLLRSGLQDRSFLMYGLVLVLKYYSKPVMQLLRYRVLPLILNTIGAPSWAVSMLEKIPFPQITT